MDEELVGYLLHCLDDNERSEVADRLERDPEARGRLEMFRSVLEPLAADRQPEASPPDLFYKTLARVAEDGARLAEEKAPQSEDSTGDLPQAPLLLAGRFPGERSRWWRMDVLVAACLLVTFLGVGIPALLHLRGQRAATLACQNNLREFFGALQSYHDVHRTFPNVQAEGEPRNVAGLLVPILVDHGALNPRISVRCPGKGAPRPCPLTLAQLRVLPEDEFLQQAPALLSCYAYSLGYFDQDKYYPAQLDPDQQLNSRLPLMADAPPPEAGNSRNHGGGGQNVLFQDGRVQFTTLRKIGVDGDDIFLNQDSKVAAGRGKYDTVLGSSAARPVPP